MLACIPGRVTRAQSTEYPAGSGSDSALAQHCGSPVEIHAPIRSSLHSVIQHRLDESMTFPGISQISRRGLGSVRFGPWVGCGFRVRVSGRSGTAPPLGLLRGQFSRRNASIRFSQDAPIVGIADEPTAIA